MSTTDRIIGTANVTVNATQYEVETPKYYAQDLHNLSIKAYLPQDLNDGQYQLQISPGTVKLIQPSEPGFESPIDEPSQKAIQSAFKTQYLYQIRQPQVESEPKTGKLNQFKAVSDFILRKQAYIAKFCDASKLLRWGFYALTFGVILLTAYHANILPTTSMNLIPSIFGIGIIGGISVTLLVVNIKRLIQAPKTGASNQKKIAIANIVFALLLISLLTIPVPLLSKALNGMGATKLIDIGFNSSNTLFGAFSIAVGLIQAYQSIKNFRRARQNKVVGDSWKEYLKSSEFQGILQIIMNASLIVTGIVAFIVVSKFASPVLATCIEATTFFNLIFATYNKSKVKNIRKEIENSTSFKAYLTKQFKITEEEEKKLSVIINKYSKKDIENWKKAHLTKEQSEILEEEFDQNKWKEFIINFYLQKAQDRKTDLFQSMMGKDLTEQAQQALIDNDSDEKLTETGGLKDKIFAAIPKRLKAENQKLTAPIIRIIAFVLLMACLPLFANMSLGYIWVLFGYGMLQFTAKALTSPTAYVKRLRNIPTEEDSPLKPINMIDDVYEYYKKQRQETAEGVERLAVRETSPLLGNTA